MKEVLSIGAIVLFIIVAVVAIIIFWIRYTFFKISKGFVKYITKTIRENIAELPEAQKLMEYDKVLDKVLGELGYQGSLGQKLKKYGKHSKSENALWAAHKERNKLAHEVGYAPSDKYLAHHTKTMHREIERILKTKIR